MWLRGEGDIKVSTLSLIILLCPQQCMIILLSPPQLIQYLVLQVNWDILTEGYTHHTQEPRTIQVKKWQLKNEKNVS